MGILSDAQAKLRALVSTVTFSAGQSSSGILCCGMANPGKRNAKYTGQSGKRREFDARNWVPASAETTEHSVNKVALTSADGVITCCHILNCHQTGVNDVAGLQHSPISRRKFAGRPNPRQHGVSQHTELVVTREGDRIIVEPREETLGDLPGLFSALKPHFSGERPEFVETGRDW
jgi:antitoxin VapB